MGGSGRALAVAAAVPPGLLALFFLHAFFMTFPMTAYGQWLFDIVHMPPATTTIYYSVTFFPWNLKPLYGLISDNFPIWGYHRKSYIILCELCTAMSFVVTGTYVRSITGAFVVKLFDAVSEAFSQIMLGVLLVDLTTGDATSKSSALVQSLANATKNAASVAALLIGIPVYKNKSIGPQQVISWTSIFPLLGALVCAFGLKELPVTREVHQHMSVGVSGMIGSGVSEFPPSITATVTWRDTMRVGWISFKADVLRKIEIMLPVLPPMLFFFLCSALPDDGTIWYQYSFSLLEDQPECLQYMSLAAMVGRFISCLAYARWCSNRNVRHVFLLSTVSSVIAGLPRLLLAPPVVDLPVSICTFVTTESFLTAFTAEFALLQLLVVATYYCPNNKEVQGLTYALYLSFMDFGGVISGLLTSAVVSLLGIVPDPVSKIIDWSHLWILVLIAAGGQLLVLAFLYVLPDKVRTDGLTRSPTSDASGGTEKLPLLAHPDGIDSRDSDDARV